jgi:hypothetical protein
MSKRDTLDPELARRFAWRTTEPAEPTPPPPAPAAEAEAPDEEEPDHAATLARCAQAQRGAAEIAQDVERAWALRGRAAQAAATAAALQQAKRHPEEQVCLREHPVACLRLWRLTARHLRRLPRRAREEHVYALVGVSPPLDEPETADLLAEVLATGDVVLTMIMTAYLTRESEARRHPAINARLARLLSEGATWAARETAASWLSAADVEAAAPALRRALRQPRLALRARALTLLVGRTPPLLDEDDVLWMLRDAHAHPMFGAKTNGQAENAREYAEALLAAAVQLRPAQGFEPLLKIVPWTCVRGEDLAGVDSAWALRVLAAAYPEQGLTTIDRQLLTYQIGRSEAALEAVALLPDALARPRLLEAAARPRHALAERAKALWFARFGEACPVGPLDGVPVSLLRGPPSERLLACVTVLRGASREACSAMLEALLAEAPPGGAPPAELTDAQREALALWIFAARDIPYSTARPSIPSSLVELLAERFGPAAFWGISILAERDARAGLPLEWFGNLPKLLETLGLGDAERERVRELARLGLASPAWEGTLEPISALRIAGRTAETVDLLLPLITAPEADATGSPYFSAGYVAMQVLGHPGEVPGLDERLLAATRAARDARAWGAFGRLGHAGCRRGVPGVVRLVMEVGDALDAEPEALRGVSYAAGAMRDRIDERWVLTRGDPAWVLAHLRRPASRAFEVAVDLVSEPPELAVLEALRDALDTDACGGVSAAEAAAELLRLKAIGAEERRLDGILERAPVDHRVMLLATLLQLEAPIATLRRHLLPLLVSCEYEEVSTIFWTLWRRDPPGKKELYEDAAPRASCASVRRELECELGEPREDETYWQSGEEDEEEADEDEETA